MFWFFVVSIISFMYAYGSAVNEYIEEQEKNGKRDIL